jgi:hypothetical protein
VASGSISYPNFEGQRKERSGTIVHVILVVISFAASALIEYGIFSEKMAEQDRRITYLESQHFIPGPNVVTHDQFDQFQKDLLIQMGELKENQKLMLRRQAGGQ